MSEGLNGWMKFDCVQYVFIKLKATLCLIVQQF